MIEILSLRHKQGRAPRVPLGLQQKQLLKAVAGAHCLLAASLSAGHLYAFFLFVFLCCGSGSFPLAAPASSGCEPPAAKGKSRISRAHYGKRPPQRSWGQKHRDIKHPYNRATVQALANSTTQQLEALVVKSQESDEGLRPSIRAYHPSIL